MMALANIATATFTVLLTLAAVQYPRAAHAEPSVAPAVAAIERDFTPTQRVEHADPVATMIPLPRLVVERLDGTALFDVAPFDAQGEPREEAFAEISFAFRARNGHQVDIDPKLIETLMMLSRAFDGRPLALVSAHRVPGRGTNKTSYHVRGMATDIVIRGVSVSDLRAAAVRLKIGGVGRYPTFVHIDVRRDYPYRWYGR
jgi:uncharacterized protein YcbK (DUF882 family)